ncbi:hypothetical protein [Xanthomarina spongicola]|uniref:Uncharacterized protein n=1 Tax=Xanthomarina spongicola TaxID=570520 RepID=A0A316DHS3_9FLAO|nr:hypothetical protein [Xanthomarina spongicola]PWK17684.1 hypothetical protein LX78_02475 [Xanthomarina spongicola]
MINKIGVYTALVSFLIGTLLLVIFYFTYSSIIAYYGLIFIIIVGIINLVILVKIVFDYNTKRENKKEYLRTALIMLLNIPIVICYTYFVIFLMNTMIVTLINETGREISQIKIIGGEPTQILKLEIGEVKTKWVGITNDNSLMIEYNVDGEIRQEVIYGYVTSFSGSRIKYKIGNETKPIDESI